EGHCDGEASSPLGAKRSGAGPFRSLFPDSERGLALLPGRKERAARRVAGRPPSSSLGTRGEYGGGQFPMLSRSSQSTGIDSARRQFRSPGPGSSFGLQLGASPSPRATIRLASIPLAT